MWPKENTAFVVIHGAGSHKPFMTLDSFVRGFWEVLKKQKPDLKVDWKHKLQRHKDWIENYISLKPTGKKATLDFYEYYWDCYMVHRIRIEEVINWLIDTSKNARKFYRKTKGVDYKMQKRLQQYEDSGVDLFKDGEFKTGGYLILLGWIGRILRLLPLKRDSKVIWFIKPIIKWASKYIVDFIGDAVIYTNSDVRSEHYAIRQKVLHGAVEELKLLLENEYYKQIIVVGHSLGSVIAYDALNRITHDINVKGGISPDKAQKKIIGIVTFGSPLDKIAFFFQEHPEDEEYVRKAIIVNFHGFKSRKLSKDIGKQDKISIKTPIEKKLDKAKWLNFYHVKDKISGALDAYEAENIECKKEAKWTRDAHIGYWSCKRMYEKIAAVFFQ